MVGVPEIVPVLVRVKPAGRFPEETVQLYGVVPPEAASAVEYATPATPFGKLDVVMVTAFGLFGGCPLELDTPAQPEPTTLRITDAVRSKRGFIRSWGTWRSKAIDRMWFVVSAIKHSL